MAESIAVTEGRRAPQRAVTHRSRVLLAAAVAAMALFLVLLVAERGRGNIDNGDSNNLVAGTRVALHCIEDGLWRECGKIAPFASTVGPYPLLQYLPAALVMGLGGSDRAALHALSWLNVVAVVGSIGLIGWTLRRRPPVAAVAVAAVAGSSLMYHSTAAFGEALAAALVLAAVVAARRAPPWAIALTVAAAGLGKETLPPFVVALCLAAASRPAGRFPPRARVTAIVGGGLAALAASALFNLFRFGTVRNAQYLLDDFRTPVPGRAAEFLAGVWFSPSSGIVVFWPVATLLVGALAWRTAARAARRDPAARWLPGAVVVLATVAFTAGLATWYSPFGWIAYGPRLAVPLLPAVVYLAADELGDRIERLGAVAWGVPLAATLMLLGYPQYASAWSYRPAIEQLIAADATCPRMTELDVFADPDGYFSCASHFMWRIRPGVMRQAATAGGADAQVARTAAAAGIASLVLGSAQLPSRRTEDDDPAR